MRQRRTSGRVPDGRSRVTSLSLSTGRTRVTSWTRSLRSDELLPDERFLLTLNHHLPDMHGQALKKEWGISPACSRVRKQKGRVTPEYVTFLQSSSWSLVASLIRLDLYLRMAGIELLVSIDRKILTSGNQVSYDENEQQHSQFPLDGCFLDVQLL